MTSTRLGAPGRLALAVVVAAALAVWGRAIVSTNIAALRLRNHLLHGAELPDAASSGPLRADLRERLHPHGALNGAGDVLSVHRYAARVMARRWAELANALEALPDSQVTWVGAGPVPPSAYAAVLQRASEQLASSNPLLAEHYGARARKALAGNRLEPDAGNVPARASAGETIAAELERDRVAAAAHDMRGLWNGSFDKWMTRNGIIPGWLEESGASDPMVETDSADGRRLLVLCTKDAPHRFTLSNGGFTPEPGRRYRLSVHVRARSAAAPTVLAGVQYLDRASGGTTGAYAFAGIPREEWTEHDVVWTMPATASGAKFVLSVSGDQPGQCAALRATGAVLLGDAPIEPVAPAQPVAPPEPPKEDVDLLSARRWALLAKALDAAPDEQLLWGRAGPVPPSAHAAVLQRAAEQLASSQPSLAQHYGARARKALRGNLLEPDPGNITVRAAAGETIAAQLERDRVAAASAGDSRLWNGSFESWMSPNGIVPGWAEESGTADIATATDAGRHALVVCTGDAPRQLTLRNGGFVPVPGRTYRLSVQVRARTAAPQTVLAGVQYLDRASSAMTGAYAFAGTPRDEWTDHQIVWTMPRDASAGKFVLSILGDKPGQCVAIRAAGAAVVSER